MSTTSINDVTNNVQTYWSPMFTKQLRADLLLPSLLSREYEGTITKGGDKVKVTQVNYPTGQTLTVGTDADTYESQEFSSSQITITANRRFVASFKFDDLISLQSQISMEGSDARNALMYSMSEQINKYCWSLASASTSSPDHSIASMSDLNAAALSAYRVLAGQAKWPKAEPWYALIDPVYNGDVCDDTTLSSSDYNGGDTPMVGGINGSKRFNFNIFEDNSLEADHGLFFYKDFAHFVSQTDVQVKISDLHPTGKFGYVLSVDLIGGGALGVDGSKKHIQVYNSSWAPHG